MTLLLVKLWLGHEMQEHVEKLRLVAVSRIRDYFLSQMALLRRPQTNVRMIQVHGLLKYADLQDFLQEASPDTALEIYQVYVESMGKVSLQYTLCHRISRKAFRCVLIFLTHLLDCYCRLCLRSFEPITHNSNSWIPPRRQRLVTT